MRRHCCLTTEMQRQRQKAKGAANDVPKDFVLIKITDYQRIMRHLAEKARNNGLVL